MHYIITGNTYRSGLFYQCGDQVVVIEKNIFKRHKFTTEDKLYVPCEGGLEMVLEQSGNIRHIGAVRTLKDKYEARKETQPMFPDFYFKKTNLEKVPLETFDFERGQRYIIKPLRGFFGTGVKEITRDTDLQKTVGEIRDELEKNAKFFTGSVLSKEEMIIEEFIDGEEYAVDMYYDSRGEPVILNITHHPKARFPEYDNVLYYTNQDIFNRLYDVATGFFKRLSPSPSITSFPIHGEFKLTSDNRFMPIELNPLRFGGFGMGDLPFYSFNINPVTAYFKDMHPNWDAVWDMHKDMNFGWVMAYNPPGVCTGSPDDREFKEFLGSSLLKYIPIDYLENPVFAICYLKSKNMEDLNKLLTLDFREYFPT